MDHTALYALLATLGTWAVTALGAATVIFFKYPSQKIMNLTLGFASGVMISAAYWSLLAPAIEKAEGASLPPYAVVTLGFLFGGIFMWGTDKIISLIRRKENTQSRAEISKRNRIFMSVFSITLHNIPEGLAIGVAFGALQHQMTPEGMMGAATLALGIGLQNFPEGAAVSLPLRREGYSRKKSFLIGQSSGIVEPIAGVLGAILVVFSEAILPYALAFAAGAMILVAVHELIPECQSEREKHPYLATMGILFGFAAMMLLDVMLG